MRLNGRWFGWLFGTPDERCVRCGRAVSEGAVLNLEHATAWSTDYICTVCEAEVARRHQITPS